ncbi:hypothetical protein PORY_001504 [Pneumocystis oryctolagi]|uniref:Uncharacterized protein n=1 Tax=Pneumocystis oryctolagi TaxID=42067 RepID=A0ACB7CC61_9ASCO|nr:hypothetical protein PORY_001504 [Pneumocystis oryctolagi]
MSNYKKEVIDSVFVTKNSKKHFSDTKFNSTYSLYEVFHNLYLGSLEGFKHEVEKKMYCITHIIGLVSFPDIVDLSNYKVLFLDVLDKEQQNIIQYFPKSIEFIQKCFNTNPESKVLIFCQAGISRSTTIAAAYLMQTLKISKEKTIELIKKTHPHAQPNPGFIDQLQLFEDCDYTPNEGKKKYREWLLKHETIMSLNAKAIPSISLYTNYESIKEREINFRCKKCRFLLANSDYIIDHSPLNDETHKISIYSSHCTHLFLEPLIWMKKELDNGNIEGKLNCPKCNSRIGKYAWQGMTCSCKKWVIPALSIQKGKIDIIKK